MTDSEDCILTNQLVIMEALQLICPRNAREQKKLTHRIRRTSHFLDYNNYPGHVKEWEDIDNNKTETSNISHMFDDKK